MSNGEASCLNIFAEKFGYTVHFKLVAADMPRNEGEGDLRALMKGAEVMLDWMQKNGYVHDTSRDRGARGGRPQPPPMVQNENGEMVEVKCGKCGGPVYDNRDRNKQRIANGERAMPIFKCKKQECGWVQWPEKDAA